MQPIQILRIALLFIVTILYIPIVGMKCDVMSRPIHCVPNTKGERNPQTGHIPRRNKRNEVTAKTAAVGITRGQYTLQAEESIKPLNLGKYTVKYMAKAMVTAQPIPEILSNIRFVNSLLHNVE